MVSTTEAVQQNGKVNISIKKCFNNMCKQETMALLIKYRI